MRLQLTDLSVRSLKFTGSRIDYWDTRLGGFGVRIGENSKTFVVKHGNRRRTLGRFPDQLSLADARSEAKKILAAAPVQGSSLTFKDAIGLFVETHCASTRLRTRRDYELTLKRHFLSPLGSKRLDEIKTSDITAIIDKVLSTPSEASHAFSYARILFRWAVERRYIERSPLEGLRQPAKTPSRDRVLTDKELKKVWIAASKCGQFGIIVKLLLLTGQRKSEIAALRKDWICDDKITLPKEMTKNAKEHTLPLCPLATSLISSIPANSETQLLFPARGSTSAPFNGFSNSKAALDKLAEINPWTLHDLRRTFATNLAALGVRLEVTEKLLNHVSGSLGGIVGIYQRHDFKKEMRAAVQQWEKRLTKIIA